MDPENGAVVLLSGGLDSSILIHHVAKGLKRNPIHALSYDYGQRHVKELQCAQWQAQQAAVAHHHTIDLAFLADILKSGTTLLRGAAEVPDLKDLESDQLEQPPTYVPNRNMMLLSVAVAYAEANGFRDVYYGAQAHDQYGYWDCTAEFLQKMNDVLSLNRKDALTIHAPFIDLKKHELIPKATELGVDLAHTWSCYRGGEKPCGTCPTCVERLKAFEQAAATDPLYYA